MSVVEAVLLIPFLWVVHVDHDLNELLEIPLDSTPCYIPFCSSWPEMEGFRYILDYYRGTSAAKAICITEWISKPH